MQIDGFWDDMTRAQKLSMEKKSLENTIGEYEDCVSELEDLKACIEMAEEAQDEELGEEAKSTFDTLSEKVEDLNLRTLLKEEYDHNNAIVTLHAGAGGTEAQDWAEMLMRMYLRWADQKGYKVTMMDVQDDTEAGIKSAEFLVEGENAYGYLRGERGVHRLVRISPFNAQAKRQTSFASVDVTPELDDTVTVDIDPQDLRIDTYRSSGAGGQHGNKTDSAVRITHLPTGIVVSCQNERSQHQNKEFAMKVLYAKLYALAKQEHMDKISDLKGNFNQIAWGSQIRSYVFQPYTMVKDHRTGEEVSNVQAVMDGRIDPFINAWLSGKRKGDANEKEI